MEISLTEYVEHISSQLYLAMSNCMLPFLNHEYLQDDFLEYILVYNILVVVDHYLEILSKQV